MLNFDLQSLQEEYRSKNMRVLLSRMIKEHPEYAEHTIVTYEVRDTGGTRLQVCKSRDEVRQVFLSPHCTSARTVRTPEPNGKSDAA